MKLLHISDSHNYHDLITIPQGVQIIIHSGDYSTSKNPEVNKIETMNFIEWYAKIYVEHKILISGNHDVFSERENIYFRSLCEHHNITYLHDEYHYIGDIKIYGNAFSPKYGEWSFMRTRDKMDKIWSKVDDDVDIMVTHGPPKGILDMTHSREGNKLELVGDTSLKKHVLYRIQPKLHLFGHVHDCKDLMNSGFKKINMFKTLFSNGCVVTDGKFGKLTSVGNLINYEQIPQIIQ